mgnify:FL=1
MVQGDQKSWNSNLLKWASGFIGGSDRSKKIESTSAVIIFCIYLKNVKFWPKVLASCMKLA